jgi:hypothetical protein
MISAIARACAESFCPSLAEIVLRAECIMAQPSAISAAIKGSRISSKSVVRSGRPGSRVPQIHRATSGLLTFMLFMYIFYI